MALFECPECGKNVSEHADTCPSCGFNIKEYFVELKEKEEEQIRKEKIKAYKEAREEEILRISKTIKRPQKPEFSSGMILYLVCAAAFLSWLCLYTRIVVNGSPSIAGWILGMAVFCGIPYWVYYGDEYGYRKQEYERKSLEASRDMKKYRYEEAVRIYDKEHFSENLKMWVMEHPEEAEKNRSEFEKQSKNMKEARGRGLCCPICGSYNVSRISTASRVISIGLVGFASEKIGKQYKCNKW